MTPLFKYYKWRPTNDQELLLKAALFKGQAAKDAWQKWESKNKIEQIDYGSYRLIPLLHHNLKVEGIDHAYKEKFKKIHIKSWANNRMLFEKLSPLLSIFHENDIQTIILKGAPLIVRYYKDIGLRPMSDLDILIPTHEAHKAIHLLQKLGWVAALNPLEKSLDSYILLRHALEFKNLAKFEMDLHWHLLKMCLSPDADQEFWDGAIPIEFNDVFSQCLNPADNLFHICIHGAFPNKVPPIRWIADAFMVLRSGEEIEWNRILVQAQRLHMILPIKAAMQYLHDVFHAPIPDDFLQHLDQLPISKQENKEYNTWNNSHFWPDNVATMLAFYPRIANDTGRSPGLLDLLRYLRDLRELDNIWQIPFSFAWNLLKRLFKIK